MAHPHLALNPTFIRLRDLPTDGRRFVYTRDSGELTPFITDLIGENSYRVELEVKPMGNVYSAQGRIETGLDQICSLCALDFVYPIRENFQEILVIRDSLSPRDHQARVNHSSELNSGGPECTELESDAFAVGEFIHELIAIQTPIKPLGKPNCDASCENYLEAIRRGWLSREEAEMKGENPFAVLKDLKLKS